MQADSLPLILGWDIAGVVETVGDSATQFSVGDEVFGLINFLAPNSAYAEFVAAPAAGGVGHFAVQIAKHLGAHIIGTASSARKAWLESLGLDQFVDYKNDDFTVNAKECDVIFDMIGGDVAKKSAIALKPAGRLVSILGHTIPDFSDWSKMHNIQASAVLVQPNGKLLDEIADLLSKETIKPVLDKVFSFSEVGNAHSYIEEAHTQGKIVLSF